MNSNKELRPAGAAKKEVASGATLTSIGEQLSNSTLVPLIIGGAAVIAAVIALLLWAGSPTFRPIYSNISEKDGGAIIAELEQRGIEYRFDERGRTIMVPSESVHKLRLQLAEVGLPEGGDSGFEIIDDQRFGISQFNEQVNFQRAMEGELAQSIKALGPVSKARVHLALAKPSVFARKEEVSKASVILTLHPGRELTKAQASAIAHMVSSSVPELQSSDVSIVDQAGKLLSMQDSGEDEIDMTRLKYSQNVEEIYQKRVERILMPIFGPNNVRVQIAADIDFTRQEETAEQFKPNQSRDGGAVRSAQLRAKAMDTTESIGGIAGALSNTPPGWLPSPIDRGRNEGQNNTEESTESKNVDYANTVNYEVDRSITHTRRQPGSVRRLTAAVIVNYRDVYDEKGNITKEKITADELTQIEALIRQAIGFNADRGDQVQVVNTMFAQTPKEEALITKWWENTDILRLIENGLRYLFAGIGALILYRIFLKPLMNRQKQVNVEKLIASGLSPEEAQARSGMAADHTGKDALKVPMVSNEYAQTYEVALSEAQSLAEKDPQVVALAIKDWLKK
jgi:flagellar M-ring protein FliF